jgi:hypothetical protein
MVLGLIALLRDGWRSLRRGRAASSRTKLGATAVDLIAPALGMPALRGRSLVLRGTLLGRPVTRLVDLALAALASGVLQVVRARGRVGDSFPRSGPGVGDRRGRLGLGSRPGARR